MKSVLRPPVLLIYAAALLQGLTLVSFPASSVVLRTVFGVTDAEYGSIFLPQVAAAIVGAVLGGALVRRLGLNRLLVIALLGNAASQVLLASLQWLPHPAALPALLVATACLGLGFGFFGAPMNTYPPHLFPKTRDTAIVAEHSIMGAGLMIGPLLLGALTPVLGWVSFPIALAAFGFLLAFAAILVDMGRDDAPEAGAQKPEGAPIASITFWAFAIAAVIYAFAEGTFSNWAVIYLQDVRHIAPAAAALGLSMFWGGLVGGRLLISALVLRVPTPAVWLTLPVLMAIAFWSLPYADTAPTGWALFALSGLACSAFFPLTVALASERFPQHAAWVSSMLIAALNIGTGLGSYLVGLLHAALPLQTVYRDSIAYPAVAFVIALWIVLRKRSSTAA